MWVLVGALAAAFAGRIVKQKTRVYGPLISLVIRIVGTLIFLAGLRFCRSR